MLLGGGSSRVGTVAENFHEADMGAVLVSQRHHFAAAPEPRAVLAQVPAFVVAAAHVQRRDHFHLDLAALAIFRGEETLRGMAQHFFAGPAKNQLGPEVPVGDEAIGVGRNDGEIDRALKNRLKTPRIGIHVARSVR